MSDYDLTVGLEIHAELNTRTKMFCDSKNDPDEKVPNTNVCPVCMGYPGSLPVINKEAVRSVLRLGVALGGEIADYTEFDRKNYFYPDIPKGYQISQYKYPLVSKGRLLGVDITRVHLEEDTASSSHDKGDYSLLDFNRAGVPLLELVTEPCIHKAEDAGAFAREFQLLLNYLGIAEANMEKGEMRVEANISVSKRGLLGSKMGTKVEVKNLNSFKAVERAIKYEFDRQIKLLESGGEVVQETRGWDENEGKTFSQREKEESHDYRYFPDPDLPKLFISEVEDFSTDKLKSSLPEPPWEKRARFIKDLGLKEDDVEIYIRDRELADRIEAVYALTKDLELLRLVSNQFISNAGTRVSSPERAIEALEMMRAGELTSNSVTSLLSDEEGREVSARESAEEKNLILISDPEELKAVVEKIIKENEEAVGEYKSGKESSLQFLVGQGMKETKGRGNPQVLKTLFEESLS